MSVVSDTVRDGVTILDNLALACPHCNGSKWMHQDGTDPVSGEFTRLFNPRMDAWPDHFEWVKTRAEEGVLDGKTPIGRATIARLQINAPDMIVLRQVQATVGLFTEIRT